ncbi:unnamed protein product [Discula destructiva]
MAKPTIKKSKGPSIHSRAARRATSPSINTDKSLKDVQPPTTSTSHRPAVLGIHQNAGVNKKVKRGRKSVLSRSARTRHDKGLEKAEAIVDRTANKIQKSKQSANSVETRKRSWDEINAAAGKASTKGKNMFEGLAEEDGGDDWEEVAELDDEMKEAEPVTTKKGAASSKGSAPAAVPQPVDDDIDIL